MSNDVVDNNKDWRAERDATVRKNRAKRKKKKKGAYNFDEIDYDLSEFYPDIIKALHHFINTKLEEYRYGPLDRERGKVGDFGIASLKKCLRECLHEGNGLLAEHEPNEQRVLLVLYWNVGNQVSFDFDSVSADPSDPRLLATLKDSEMSKGTMDEFGLALIDINGRIIIPEYKVEKTISISNLNLNGKHYTYEPL